MRAYVATPAGVDPLSILRMQALRPVDASASFAAHHGEQAKATLWEASHSHIADKRYYTVWKAPTTDGDIVGIHASEGATGYHEIVSSTPEAESTSTARILRGPMRDHHIV